MNQWMIILIELVVAGIIGGVIWMLERGVPLRRKMLTAPGAYGSVRAMVTEHHDMTSLQVDGVELANESRVILSGQTNPCQNGIWVVKSNKWVRATDLERDDQVVVGNTVFVEEGDNNGERMVVLQVKPNTARERCEGISYPLYFVALLDMVLGTNSRVDGHVLSYRHGRPVWTVMPEPAVGTCSRETITWNLTPQSLSCQFVTWKEPWLSTDRDTLWIVYFQTPYNDQLIVSRAEVLISRLNDEAKVLVVNSTLMTSGKAAKHIAFSFQHPDGNAWWTPQEHRVLMVTCENKTQDNLQCQVQLVQIV